MADRVTVRLGELLGGTPARVEAAADGVGSGLDSLRAELSLPRRAVVDVDRCAVGPEGDLFPASLCVGEYRLPLGHHALAWAMAKATGDWAAPNSRDEVDAGLVELDPATLRAVIHHATWSIASRQPAILFGDAEATALAAECGCTETARLLELARRLLDMRISLADRDALGVAANETGQPIDETSEQLIARLRPSHLAILMEPELLRSVTSAADNDDGRGLFQFARDGLLGELGIPLPPIKLQPAPDLPRGFAAFQFNDLPTEAFRVPWPSEVLTGDTLPGAVATRNVAGNRPAYVLPVERLAPSGAQLGTAWSGLEYIILALAHMVRRHGYVLMDMAVAQERLETLHGQFPDLAAVASTVCSLPRFSMLLRSLLRSRVSIADLVTIAQAVVDRPDAPESLVRRRLAPMATAYLAAQTSTVIAYLLAPDIERTLADAPAQPWLPPVEPATSGLRRALGNELRAVSPSSLFPCVLTRDSTRTAAAAALRVSHPDVIVTSYGDLPAWINIYPVSRLTLNDTTGEQ